MGAGALTVQVSDAPLTDISAPVIFSASADTATGNLALATFSDPGSDGTTADYSGTIGWGDGQTSPFSSADVLRLSATTFSVKGSHTYTTDGSYQVQVTINDVGGSIVLAQDTTIDVATFSATTTLTSSLNPSQSGQAVTFTATITPVSGSANPGGSVTFTDDGTAIGTVAVSTSGNVTSAAILDPNLTVGDHTIVATYSGDSNYGGSTATLVQQVSWDFDFTAPYDVSNPGQVSPTQPGYQRVDQAQTFDGSYGWQSAVSSFDRNVSLLQAPAAGVPDFRSLLQAGDYGFGSNTFEAALAPGAMW